MYEIIVNPTSRSGKSKLLWENIEKRLKEKSVSYRVHFTQDFSTEDNTVADLYDEYLKKGEVLHLIIMGGDGTVNGIIQRLPAFDNVKVSVIPTGSSNDMVRDLGFTGSPEDIALKVVERPEEMKIDVGVLHCENRLVRTGSMNIPDRRFLVSTGIGYDAAVCEEALHSKIKNFFNKIGLGKLTYLGIALKQLARTKYITGELKLDDDETIIPLERFLFVAGMNHRYEGGGFMFGPEANNHDGKLELCAVSKIKKGKILRVLPTAFKGEHFRYDGVDHYSANKYTVRTSVPLWVHVDGEVATLADFIEVKVMQEVLTLVY